MALGAIGRATQRLVGLCKRPGRNLRANGEPIDARQDGKHGEEETTPDEHGGAFLTGLRFAQYWYPAIQPGLSTWSIHTEGAAASKYYHASPCESSDFLKQAFVAFPMRNDALHILRIVLCQRGDPISFGVVQMAMVFGRFGRV